jgi:PAS domain S-box-containing protein
LNHDEFATALLESSPDGLLVVDSDGLIELANPSACKMFGYGPGELLGRSVDELVPVEQREQHVRLRERYSEHPAIRSMGTGLRLFGQHCDGSLFPVEISISPLTHEGELRTIATVRDVTDREEIASRVAMMRDRERIARDLHDMVIQRLFAAGMNLQAVAGDSQSAFVADRIRETVDELDEAISELRAAIFRLGADDEQRSVSTQLVELVHERGRSLGFAPRLEMTGEVDGLADFVVEQLVATVNEGLSNVARHSGATATTVNIHRADSRLRLEITDNGSGMGEKPKRHGGISNMMWRAAELGGTCTVGAAQPEGMTLIWSVPV